MDEFYDFARDFFGLDRRRSMADGLYDTFGKEVVDQAMALAKGQPPEANLMPYIQIVLDAARLHLKIVRSDSASEGSK